MKLRSGRIIQRRASSPSKQIDPGLLNTWIMYDAKRMDADKLDINDIYAEYKRCTPVQKDIVDSVIHSVNHWRVDNPFAVSYDITDIITSILDGRSWTEVPWVTLSKYLLRERDLWICTIAMNEYDGSIDNVDVFNYANQTFDHFIIECCLDELTRANQGQPTTIAQHFHVNKRRHIMVTARYYDPISHRYELWDPDDQ